jgi:hemerythrin-like metal-binding protein
MATIEWSDALLLGVDAMDGTHREFIAHLDALAEAAPARMLECFDRLYGHTHDHFRREQAWMEQIVFPPIHCHSAEHEGVLEVMRDVRCHLGAGDFEVGRVLARELAEWFRGHAATMDAMLAQALQAHGILEAPA